MAKIAVIGIVGESVFLRVPHHQAVGETAHATSIHRELGGKGYNQAVAAARFGAEVSFLGAIHNSDLNSYTEYTVREGIAPTFATKDEPSPYGVIVTDSTGDNRVTVYAGAELSPEDVLEYREMIATADVLLINNEVPEAVNVAAVRIAKENGVTVILNPAPARPVCDYLMENVDLFTPNEHELAALGDVKNAVVTLGGDGSMTLYDGVRYPAVSFGEVVDTTGAGDTFSGVLAAIIAKRGGLSRDSLPGLSLECMVAGAAASIEVTRRYVMPAIPDRDEVYARLSRDDIQ